MTNPFKRGRISIDARAQCPEPVVAEGIATIRLYEPIDSMGGEWGVSAKEFTAALDQLPDDTSEIHVLINSPGGEVWDGLAMLNALRAHPARVVAIVEGIAASAASFIAAGVDECVMARNSQLFIHNAWGMAMGDADDLEAVAQDLAHLDQNLADIYAGKSGKDADFWLAEMKRDHYFSAEEAIEAGLADRITEGGDAAGARALFDLSAFNARRSEPGRHAAPAAASLIADPDLPVSSEPGNTNRKELDMSDILTADLRERLGLTDAATDEELRAALESAIPAAAPAAPVTPAEPAAVAPLPEGVVAIDATILEQLQSDAAAGREAREQQSTERRELVLARAQQEGRIAASSAEHFRALLSKDEASTTALIQSLAPNTAIPVAQLGHQVEPTDEESLMAAAGWAPKTTKEV